MAQYLGDLKTDSNFENYPYTPNALPSLGVRILRFRFRAFVATSLGGCIRGTLRRYRHLLVSKVPFKRARSRAQKGPL